MATYHCYHWVDGHPSEGDVNEVCCDCGHVQQDEYDLTGCVYDDDA